MKLMSILAVLCILGGCQNVNPSVSVFQLSIGPKATTVDFNATQLIVERISVVDYLKQSNIVFAQENGELISTRYQLWAEPIDKGITRSLVNEINSTQDKIRADSHVFSTCREQGQCYRLQVQVERFYPSFDSTVRFSGKYKLFYDQQLIEQSDFNLQKTLTDDGYSHAVEALNSLVNELGQTITSRISQQR